MPLQVVNPSTGELIREVRLSTPKDVDQAIEKALTAFGAWRASDDGSRGGVLLRAGALLRERADTWGALMAEEMGKPIWQGRAEAEKCAWVCDYYADNAGRHLAPEIAETSAARSYVTFEPLGVVLSIMPWNFPFWQVFRFVAPALMAGNVVLLKHAPNVPGCAAAIEGLLLEAGLPEGVLCALYLGNEETEALIDRPEIRAVTLTGSTRAGRAVGARAGAALKKVVLELGGSDAYLILSDADLERAVEAAATSRLNNSGQSCIAAKRLIVVEELHEEFCQRLVARMGSVRVGDPMAGGTDVGPLAREDLRDTLHRQVTDSIAAGAGLALGGSVHPGPGWFYPPTVLTGVGPGMPAYEEELFGPVAAVIRVADEEEAVRVANDSAFGLGGAVFTADRDRGERIAANELEVGCAFVNDYVRSDPRVPFGGVKESGFGRELGIFGIREFVNVKTVWVA